MNNFIFKKIERLLKKTFKTQKGLFTFLGASLGATFPVGAIIIDYFIKGQQYNIIEIYNLNPLHYLIMTSPIVLGLLTRLAGMRDDRLQLQQKQIEKTNSEMRDILSHIGEGILTINKESKINKEYSLFLEKLFNRRELSGYLLNDLFYTNGETEQSEILSEYLQLLFNNHTATEEVIQELNPVKKLEITRSLSPGQISMMYIRTEFVRIFVNGLVEKIMVIIADETRSIAAERARMKEKEEHAFELETIASILKVSAEELNEFLKKCNQMSQLIESSFSKDHLPEYKISDLFKLKRGLHSLKGEARLHNFHKAAYALHALETTLSSQRFEEFLNLDYNKKLSAENEHLILHFSMDIMMSLSNFKMTVNGIIETHQKISEQLKTGLAVKTTSSTASVSVFLPQLISIQDNLNSIIKSINQKEQISKSWIQNLESLLITSLSELEKENIVKKLKPLKVIAEVEEREIEQLKPLRSALIHLLQNALYHGIETVSERIRKNKFPQGQITITIVKKDFYFNISIIDDGAGIDFEKLKNMHAGENISEHELAGLLFKSGISTANSVTAIAGRGVGMDAVKEIVSELGGKIRLKNKKDGGLTILLVLPQSSFLKEV